MKIIKTALLSLLLPLAATAQTPDISPDKTLWYRYPAKDWNTQALHIGNGYMGASFYGGIHDERLDIAEETFWTGTPHREIRLSNGQQPGGKETVNTIRQEILQGNYAKADQLTARYLTSNMQGYGYFSNVGQLRLHFREQADTITDYRRGLDLGQAFGFVDYRCGDVGYHRAYFCNYPDKVMVLHLSADRPGQLSLDVEHTLTHPAESAEFTDGREWVIRGKIAENNLRYVIRLQVEAQGGKVTCSEGKLSIDRASGVNLYYTVDTEYLQSSPDYRGVDPEATTREVMAAARRTGYDRLWQRHTADYQSLFNRVALRLTGDSRLEQLPTDERIRQLQQGMTDDSQLKAMWFNFARYMIISASRANTLPSNLQGVWNASRKAAWNGNYQSNINLQEMYWSCGPTRLEECEEAYINWIANLVPSGRKTARAYYGTEGWISNATGDIWGFTSPGSEILWGLYPCGSAWHCRHLWEHYAFTQDREYLEKVYPIMKEAAEFWLANLTEKDGKYIVIPSISAEHGIQVDEKGVPVSYTDVNGESGRKIYSVPAFQDIAMVKNLFCDVSRAMTVLGKDRDLQKTIDRTIERMQPFKIGRYGQLQEWLNDYDNPRDHHRHVAHLYAMYPGDLITPQRTPELAEAVRNSLLLRGYGTFGSRWPHAGGNWSMIWRTMLWTRLGDGNRAIDAFNTMIRDCGFENMGSHQSGRFMVDAIMATAGVFAEMLAQSLDNTVYLLPALPVEWPEGSVEGIRLRGGYLVDISWKAGQLTSATLHVPAGQKNPQVIYRGKKADKQLVRIVSLPA